MPFTLYDVSVPTFLHFFNTLSHILKKAEAYAAEKGIPESEFMSASIHPDMKALPFQIQTCTSQANGALTHIAGKEIPQWEYNETTFAQLQERISKEVALLKDADAKAFEGQEEKEVVLKFPGREFKFTGKDYILNFVLPNFYFHVTTAYDILRAKGVELGKRDFLMPPQ